MRRIFTAILTTTALTATTALAAEGDMQGICNNAFYHGDQDGDGRLSQAEIEKTRDAEFANLDLNEDGSIDREEFATCMASQRKAANQAVADGEDDMSAKWEDVAREGQTEMTREDYAAWAQEVWDRGGSDKADGAAAEDEAEGGPSAHERFAQAAVNRFQATDTDGDGVLSQEEFETPARKEEFDPKGLDAQFQEMDADNSGAVSPMEYSGAAAWSTSAMGADTDGGETGTSTGNTASQTDDEAAANGGIPVIRYYILTY
ncbi:hypothetical protein D6850_12065 [Roseovarius spongiae]|uniref:EF-hand domain-containing protein n=1 Tax=Roseovarius spongiae TaxID=2320272 RepID=A0A3A8ATC9_9RHOB|nr:EF-hand domain-containing protein [Roseovarius spongiae]RKF13921.1 hypothetical protein D6850_12065 [Roseovarius spongiae]